MNLYLYLRYRWRLHWRLRTLRRDATNRKAMGEALRYAKTLKELRDRADSSRG